MGGSPNWSTLTMRLGYDMTEAMHQAEKALGHWIHTLNDQWNIHGLVAGVGYLIIYYFLFLLQMISRRWFTIVYSSLWISYGFGIDV
jgi:hypothetical protein